MQRIEVSETVTTVCQTGRKFIVVKVRDISSSVSLTLTSSWASPLSRGSKDGSGERRLIYVAGLLRDPDPDSGDSQ